METAVNNGVSTCESQQSSLGNNSRIAWGAIFIGTIVSLGYEVLLNFLGIGLGLSAFDLNGEKMFQIGIGAIIWLAASGIISMGIGGYFVGLFSNITCNFKNGCHAVAAWSLATLITVLMTTAASGAFIGGGINIAKSSTTVMTQNLSQTNSQQGADSSQNQTSDNTEPSNIKEKANSATNQMGKASIVLFFAFLLSGIASVAGAIIATKKSAVKVQ